MDSYKKSRRKSIIAWVIAFVLAIGAAIVSFTPFIFMVLNSFKEKFEMLTKGVFQLPDQLNWSNYTEVLTGGLQITSRQCDRSCNLPDPVIGDSKGCCQYKILRDILCICNFSDSIRHQYPSKVCCRNQRKKRIQEFINYIVN